jgi:hypothetical protein
MKVTKLIQFILIGITSWPNPKRNARHRPPISPTPAEWSDDGCKFGERGADAADGKIPTIGNSAPPARGAAPRASAFT